MLVSFSWIPPAERRQDTIVDNRWVRDYSIWRARGDCKSPRPSTHVPNLIALQSSYRPGQDIQGYMRVHIWEDSRNLVSGNFRHVPLTFTVPSANTGHPKVSSKTQEARYADQKPLSLVGVRASRRVRARGEVAHPPGKGEEGRDLAISQVEAIHREWCHDVKVPGVKRIAGNKCHRKRIGGGPEELMSQIPEC
ncbi:hypothetical protein BC834DRAFT_44127 [Gloeopeniophorella convolvens]|nr:hypothetical protein BC834DRAFT_44127 [Gloeopeniophorella convolvens]